MSPLDLSPFRLLIDQVVAPARRTLTRLYLPLALPLVVAGLLLVWFQIRWLGAAEALAAGESPETQLAVLGTSLLILAVILVLYVVTFTAIVAVASDVLAGHPPSARRAWAFALRPATALTLFAVLGLSTLAFCMCFVPALYVVPVLSLAVPIMAMEGRFGFHAIQRSFQLAHFNPEGGLATLPWLRCLVLLFIGLVVQNLAILPVQLPFVIVQQVVLLRSAAGGETDASLILSETLWLQVPTSVLVALVTGATWFYSAFALTAYFRDLRRMKEGDDLARAIDDVVQAPSAAAPPLA